MTEDERREKKLKWSRRITFLVLGALVCLPLVLTQTGWGRARMRDLAVEALRTELGLEARLGEVRIDVGAFPPRVVVAADDIVLDDPVYGRFLEAEALRIRPSFVALLQGKLDLNEIEVDRPAITLIVRDGEVRNLPRPRAQSEGPSELPFQRIRVNAARIAVDAQPLVDAVLDPVDVTLVVHEGTRLAVAVEAGGGEVRHALGTEEIQRLVVEARVDPERAADLDYLVLRTPHLRVGAHDARVDLPFTHTYAGEVEVRLHLDHLRELPFGVDLPPLSGWVEARANLNGTPDGPMGQADVRLDNVIIDDRGLGDTVDIALDFDPNELRIAASEFRLVRDGGVVRAEGTIGLRGDMPVDVHIDIDRLQFAKLMEQLGVTPNAIVQWELSGRASLAGTLLPLNLSGPIHTQTRDFLVTTGAWHDRSSERVISFTRGNIGGTWSVRPDALRFENLTGETARSHLTADVLIGFHNELAVRARGQVIDLEDIGPLLNFELGGRGNVAVDVVGTLSDPQVTGHMIFADFAFDTFPFGDVESDMQLEKGGIAVRFPSVRAEKGNSRYRVDDLFMDFSDGRFVTTATVHAREITLADVYHTFHFDQDERFESIQATGAGTVGLRFTLGFPGDSPTGTLVADLDMTMDTAQIAGFAFTDGIFRARWRWLHYEQSYEGGILDVWDATLHKGAGTATLMGRMDLGGRLQMTATADQFELHETEGFRERLAAMTGIYGVQAEIRGTPSVPRIDMDLGVTGLSWDGALLGDGRMYVRLTDRDDPWVREAATWHPRNPPPGEPCAHARAGFYHGRWAADPPLRTAEGFVPALEKPMAYLVCGEGAGGRLALDMAFGWTEVYPLRGRLDLDDFPLDSVLQQTTGDDQVRGALTGHAFFDGGAMLADDTLEGEVLLSQMHIEAGGVTLDNHGDVDVILRGGEGFQIARAEFRGAGSELAVGGTGLSTALALQVDGDVDLGLLATLSSTVDRAHGRVALRVNVTGDTADPAIFGEALVQDAGFHFAGFPAPIDELEGRVSFSSHRVLLEDFRARVAGGELAFGGSARLADGAISEYLVDLDARDIFLAPEPGVEVAFGAQTRLAWQQEDRLPLLTGRLVLDRVRFTRPISLSPTIGEINRAQRAEVERYDPNADRVAVDMTLVTRRPISVTNNLIDADIVVDDTEREFRIVGTDQRYGVLGSLAIPRGFLKLRGTELAIREAAIDFVDETRVDPQFDVLATTEVRRTSDPTSPDWQITLRAHGNMDGFQLDLSSQPQMPQEDVLMLLTFGMTRTEAEQLQAQDLGGAGLEALSRGLGVNDEVTRAVGLIDEFGITSRYSEQTNRPEPHVTIGKRISDRVRLTGSTSLTGESREVRGSVVVQVGDQTSIEAGYDNANRETGSAFGNLGVDFRWRLEFD